MAHEMRFPLAGRRALVTGGARRIGWGIVGTLAAAGAEVVIHYHASKDGALALANELRDGGRRAATVTGDLRDPDRAAALLADADRPLGPVDILVNNAASFADDDLATCRWEDWQASLSLDAWAPFALSRAFADGREGAVVNVLDTRVADGLDPSHLSYSLAKGVLAVLTRTCARTFAPRVRVNAVAPGAILSPPGDDGSLRDRLAATTPLGRAGSPAAVADAVAFLAASDAVTGQVLYVDGGAHLGGRS